MKKALMEFVNQRFENYDKQKMKTIVEKWIDEGLKEPEILFFLEHRRSSGSPDVSQSKEDFGAGWNAAMDFNKFISNR